MRLHLLLSKPPLDRVAESMDYDQASGVRDAPVGIEFVHNHFVFDNHRGDPPHARVSLTWTDVEALIHTFVEKGHPEAPRLNRARKLAASIDEFSKNSD
jgi:hypothetical protein